MPKRPCLVRTPSPPPPGEPLTLRLLLDGSALEVFTGSGEALTTRVYRGHPPEAAFTGDGAAGEEEEGGGGAPRAGVCLFASGAPCVASRVEAYEMAPCWRGAAAEGEAAGGAEGEGGGPEVAESVSASDEEGPASPRAVVRAEFLHTLHLLP